jgi:hypothetical protein
MSVAEALSLLSSSVSVDAVKDALSRLRDVVAKVCRTERLAMVADRAHAGDGGSGQQVLPRGCRRPLSALISRYHSASFYRRHFDVIAEALIRNVAPTWLPLLSSTDRQDLFQDVFRRAPSAAALASLSGALQWIHSLSQGRHVHRFLLQTVLHELAFILEAVRAWTHRRARARWD